MSSSEHPARSIEFLSRLHDGELSPAERAHFESHRAHCAECRKAAADFEDALAVYRTAGTSPASSDLAARILRRLESSNRRRSPFGVVFGIDLGWAGAFSAALIAVIFGYAVLERRESVRQIPITFAQPTAVPSGSRPAAPLAAAPQQSLARRPDTRTEPRAKENLAAPPEASAPPLAKAAATVVLEAADTAAATPAPHAPSSAAEAKRSRAPARPKAEEPASGGAGETSSEEAPASRIVVTPLDGEGAAPVAINDEALTFRREDHGRYVLVVGANGVPIDVGPFAATAKARVGALSRSADQALRNLRFHPGTRPRRLLVSVE